jgi:hypothetical protein
MYQNTCKLELVSLAIVYVPSDDLMRRQGLMEYSNGVFYYTLAEKTMAHACRQ